MWVKKKPSVPWEAAKLTTQRVSSACHPPCSTQIDTLPGFSRKKIGSCPGHEGWGRGDFKNHPPTSLTPPPNHPELPAGSLLQLWWFCLFQGWGPALTHTPHTHTNTNTHSCEWHFYHCNELKAGWGEWVISTPPQEKDPRKEIRKCHSARTSGYTPKTPMCSVPISRMGAMGSGPTPTYYDSLDLGSVYFKNKIQHEHQLWNTSLYNPNAPIMYESVHSFIPVQKTCS